MTEDRLAQLFPPGAALCVATPDLYDAPLTAAEAGWMADAVEARRREFAAGRACARQALARLGVSDAGLGRSPDRSPIWPAGVVGSISHSRGFCVAVAARQRDVAALGMDVETAGPLEAGVEAMVCSAGELDALADQAGPLRSAGSKLLFCGKEALYKAYYPRHRTFLGFHDVEMAVDAVDECSGTLRARLVGPSLPGDDFIAALRIAWRLDAERVYCGASLEA
ncbi:MAG TPA: 4'-phosphopantetheinyl transferase superfamily protein [Allosphingosinicella sp.]